MKLSDLLPRLKAIAMQYGIEKASYRVSFAIWDHYHMKELDPGYSVSMILNQVAQITCIQGDGATIEKCLENFENRIIDTGFFFKVPVISSPSPEPELA